MLRTSVRQPVHLNEYIGYMLGLEHRHCLLFACPLTDRTGAAPAVKGEPTPLVGPPPRSRGYRLLQIRGLSLGTVRFAPVMYEDSGPATNATNAATSSTCP